MAGHGPAPKLPEQRRDAHAKLRGDWVLIPARSGLRIPPLPDREKPWSERSARDWAAFWSDGAAVEWGSADLGALEQLIELVDDFYGGKRALAGEIRLRMDGLGLTPKGKRDLRLRVEADEPSEGGRQPARKPSKSSYTHLRPVL